MKPADKCVSLTNTITVIPRGSVNIPGSSVKVLYSFVNTNFLISGFVWSLLLICDFCVRRNPTPQNAQIKTQKKQKEETV